MCDGSDNNSRSCGLQYSIRGLNWILQCDLHQDRGHSTCGSNFSPRPWNCINRHFLLWASVYPFWFVPVLHMQLITPNHSLTTHPCWPSAVKNLDNADSIFRILKHSTQLSCASCVCYNIRQLGVGKNPTDLRAIVIVIVPSIHTDTDTREFPR